jgi:hypothetical protein
MPEFTVKEVRLPELHLPEVKRDEIVRALSGIHVPEVDRAMAEPRKRLRNLDLRAFPWRQRLSGVDAGKVVAAAVTASRIARPARTRSRWSPFRKSRWAAVSRSRDNVVAMVRPAPRRSRRGFAAIAIALLAAAAWMLLRNPGFRARLDRAAADARRRIDGMRSQGMTAADLETGEPVSVTTTEIAPTGVVDSVATQAATEVTEGATNPA